MAEDHPTLFPLGEILYCCRVCKERKPASKYSKRHKNRQELQHQCKACARAYFKAWCKANPENVLNWHRRYGLKQYGLTVREFAEMLERQAGVCAICGKSETSKNKGRVQPLSVDHDHATGKVRGLLCRNCNHLLGYALDDVALLESASAYLRRCTPEYMKWLAKQDDRQEEKPCGQMPTSNEVELDPLHPSWVPPI